MYYNGIMLKMLPVCECGEIIRDIYAVESFDRHDGYRTKEVHFMPVCCPFCGTEIKGISIDNKYFDFFKDGGK